MTSQVVATLVLRSDDVPTNSYDNTGGSDTYNTSFTWNNINMRSVLGDMYDKYDDFNIANSFLSVSYCPVYGTTAGDRAVSFNISGLTFKNSSYSFPNKGNIQSCQFLTAIFGNSTTAASSGAQNVDTTALAFTKNELVNITIFYTRIFKNTTTLNYNIATTTSFPAVQFTFKITGIPRVNTPQLINFN